MWFKRRKKTEQDQALSQSLRSLQSLLNENDERREPSLDPRHGETGDKAGPAPALTRRVPAASGSDSEAGDRRDPGPREPAPPDSASRWRDINLSFDAEPVVPRRPKRGPDIESADHAAGATDAAPDPAGETGETETTPGGSPDGPSTLVFEDDLESDMYAEPVLDEESSPAEAWISDEAPASDETPPGPMDESSTPVDAAPVDLEAFPDTPPGGHEAALDPLTEPDPVEPPTPAESTESVEPAETDDESPGIEWEEPTMLGVEAPGPPAAASSDEHGEDQLHLELEPADDAIEDDIPVLTEAVYVPDTPPETASPGTDRPEPAPAADTPEIDAPAADSDIERCIDQLRTRLQVMDVDALTPEQEAQLRDTLEELLEDRRDGRSSV